MSNTPLPSFAIICALVAALAFSGIDAVIKLLSAGYPLHQIVLIRAVIAMVLTLGLFAPMEGGFGALKTRFVTRHLLRSGSVILANSLFFLGLSAMPLAEATAIFFIAPLFVTVLSEIFLREVVGIWRWIAVCVGLIGAIIIIRPSTLGFQIVALLPLASALCYATLHIFTRSMKETETAAAMTFYIQLGFIVVSVLMGLTVGHGAYAPDTGPLNFLLRAWVWPTSSDWVLFVIIGLASGIAGYCISQAYRLAPAALIAPFEYISLIAAVLWGYLLFRELPDAIAWAGIALILGGGLLMLWREAVANSAARKLPQTR